MESQRNVAYSKNKKIKIKHNRHQHKITQMMVGKQWVKRWGMYRWARAGEGFKEASSNNGYEAEGKAF